MEGASLTIDLSALQKIKKQLDKKREVAVGIFEEDDLRPDGKSNIEIGKDHEFGNPITNLPMRSWLREPIYSKEQRLTEVVQSSLDKDPNVNKALKVLAKEAEKIVKEGFDIGGDPKWEELSDYTVAKKGDNTILVERGYLKKAVKAKVVNEGDLIDESDESIPY